MIERRDAEALDAANPLAEFRPRFVLGERDGIYLDGNSLGRPPRATADRIARAIDAEWGGELVTAWERWIDLPLAVGDRLGAAVLGAQPGQVAVADSTTVNLFKLATAACAAQPDRRAIVTDAANFPTDRYVLEGVAADRGLELRIVDGDPLDAVDRDVALVSLSLVSYTSAAILDVARTAQVAHDAGALVLLDLSHAAGAVPLALDEWKVDLAAGCTYKYLHAGPGAPGYVYVARRHHEVLAPPIWGWWAQRDQFAMGPRFDPVDGIAKFLSGTPNILGVMAVDEGVKLVAEAGIAAIRKRSVELTALLIDLAGDRLAPLGFELRSPRDPARRGGHVALSHPDARAISAELRTRAGVVVDYREPDLIRLAPTPLDTRAVDVWDGIDRLAALVASGGHHRTEVTYRVT